MQKASRRCFTLFLTVLGLILASSSIFGQETKKLTPANGHTIHVVAPHVVDGKVMGPFHHYCKPVSDTLIECLIYNSEDPKAMLTQVEYFIAKSVTTPNVPLDVWNKFYHDHAIEIASGRVKVLDAADEEAKKIVAVASKTDGIIFALWQPEGAKAPLGEVKHAQAVSHKPMTNVEYNNPKR